MTTTVALIIGVLLGGGIALVIFLLRSRQEQTFAKQLLEETQQQKEKELSETKAQFETTFAAISRKALSDNSEDFLKLAKVKLEQQKNENEQTLETKKKLIDARLEEMGGKLTELNKLIHAVEKQRAESHGSLKTQIEKTTQVTQRLSDTTNDLREALANPQRRGQWGERMAEDVLRLAGLVEGINYQKQQSLAEGTRPDFTFLLPGDRRVHMDVKFPLANYMKMLDAENDTAREEATSSFLRDVRSRIKEVTTRSYIDPAAGTVDYVIVFFPNEQIYSFIHENDARLLDDALQRKVVLCSPMTLYAILAVIRQAMENFHLEQGSRQVLQLLSEFKKQWGKYVEGMDLMGKRLDQAVDKYRELAGVRTQKLDRQLDRIEDVQNQLAQEPGSGPRDETTMIPRRSASEETPS